MKFCICGRKLKDNETPLDCSSKSSFHYNSLKYANRHMYPNEYISEIYLLYPTILKGFEVDLWKANRRKVLVDYAKREKIDGIKRLRIITATAYWKGTPDNYDEPL